MLRFCVFPGFCVSVVLLCGCGPAPAPHFEANRVELLKQERLYLGEGESFSRESAGEIQTLMKTLFGSPDQALLGGVGAPGSDGAWLDPELLEMAAGAVLSEQDGTPHGLYREHCVQCHGLTGNGAGPTAALLNPYPRDFRMGKFKFKSTPPRYPPTDDDLKRTLLHGIPGTAMPSFQRLPERELDALIDYVKYLSIRGQYERYLMAELPALNGQPFVDEADRDAWLTDNLSTESTVELKQHLDTVLGNEFNEYVLDRWSAAATAISEVPPVPPSIDPFHPGFSNQVAQGEALFRGKASCYQCHGEDGRGTGTLVNYDDWTNDWLKSPGVDPADRASYAEFLRAGAFPPRVVRPRNLHLAVFRGGGSDLQLYRQISNGIEGTPMPAATALTSEEVWALVAYVKSFGGQRGSTLEAGNGQPAHAPVVASALSQR